MAYLVEQAGGKAMAKEDLNILDIMPTHIHQRSPIYLGSSEDVDEAMQFLAEAEEKMISESWHFFPIFSLIDITRIDIVYNVFN